jgi:hypothetical protein
MKYINELTRRSTAPGISVLLIKYSYLQNNCIICFSIILRDHVDIECCLNGTRNTQG